MGKMMEGFWNIERNGKVKKCTSAFLKKRYVIRLTWHFGSLGDIRQEPPWLMYGGYKVTMSVFSLKIPQATRLFRRPLAMTNQVYFYSIFVKEHT